MPGVRFPLLDLYMGKWKQKLTQELYTQLDWGGPVSNLLFPRYIPKHMSMFDAPSSMLLSSFQSSSFAHGIWNTTKFFVGLDIFDRAIAPSFKGWINATASKEMDKIMEPYAAIFDPKRLQEDVEYEEEVLANLQEQGFNTAPLNPSYEDIAVTADPLTEHEGASLSFPLVAAMHYSSALPLTFWDSPFKSETQEMLVRSQANRLEINRIVRKYHKAKDRQQVNDFYQQLLGWSSQNRRDFEQVFALFKQTIPDGWAQDEANVSRMLDLFETEIRAALSIENAGKSSKQLERVFKKYQKQIDNEVIRLDNKFINAVLQIDQLIAYWQFMKDSFKEDLEVDLQDNDCSFLIPEIGPWVKRYEQVVGKFIATLERIKQSTVSMEEKARKIDESFTEFSEKKEQFFREMDLWRLKAVSSQEVSADESSNVSTAPY